MSNAADLKDTDKEAPPPKRDRTRGENIFDWSVYGGISWVANAILSVAAGYALTEGRWKEKGTACMNTLDRITNTAPSGMHDGKPIPSKGSKFAFMVTALFMGGNLLTIPIRVLEGYRGSIIRWLDGISKNGKHSPEELNAIHEEMDKQPQQSFGSLLGGRVVTLGLGLSTIPTIGNSDGLISRVFKGTRLQKFTNMEDLGNLTGDSFTKLAYGEKTQRKFPLVKNPVDKKVSHGLTNMLVTDLVIGLFTASCFYISTRFFAKVIKDKKEDRQFAKEYRAEHAIFTDKPLADAAPALEEKKDTPETPGKKVEQVVAAAERVTPGTTQEREQAQALRA